MASGHTKILLGTFTVLGLLLSVLSLVSSHRPARRGRIAAVERPQLAMAGSPHRPTSWAATSTATQPVALAPMAGSPLPPAPPPAPLLPSWQDRQPFVVPVCNRYRVALQRVMRCPTIDDRKKELEQWHWDGMRAPSLARLTSDDEIRHNMVAACEHDALALEESATMRDCPP